MNTTAEPDAPREVVAMSFAMDPLPVERMNAVAHDLATAYRTNVDPYSHVVVDDLFDPAILRQIAAEFPPLSALDHWDSQHEDKYTSDGDRGLPPLTRSFLYHLNSRMFIRFIEHITGLTGLIADPAPGIHEVPRGGFLEVHVDYNRHPATLLERRINLFVYLNENWRSEYHGDLELWDAKAGRCVKKIAPRFNRMLLFPVTDTAYHGHPTPLACPPGMSRKTLHASYYSVARPAGETSLRRSRFVTTHGALARTAIQNLRRWVPPALLDLLRKA